MLNASFFYGHNPSVNMILEKKGVDFYCGKRIYYIGTMQGFINKMQGKEEEPCIKADQATVLKLIKDLNVKKLKVRESAIKTLSSMDPAIIPFLEKRVETAEDFETKISLKEILKELKIKKLIKEKRKAFDEDLTNKIR